MNTISATISHIIQSKNLGLVSLECGFGRLNALIITDDRQAQYWQVGDEVNAIFKQTQVLVCKADCIESFNTKKSHKDSMQSPPTTQTFILPTQNCIISKITEITKEDIITRIECEAGISAIVASVDCNALGLENGQVCAWLINPSDVLLELRKS